MTTQIPRLYSSRNNTRRFIFIAMTIFAIFLMVNYAQSGSLEQYEFSGPSLIIIEYFFFPFLFSFLNGYLYEDATTSITLGVTPSMSFVLLSYTGYYPGEGPTALIAVIFLLPGLSAALTGFITSVLGKQIFHETQEHSLAEDIYIDPDSVFIPIFALLLIGLGIAEGFLFGPIFSGLCFIFGGVTVIAYFCNWISERVAAISFAISILLGGIIFILTFGGY